MSNRRATTADGRTSVNEPPLASNCWCASISARNPLESTNSTPLRSISSDGVVVWRRPLRDLPVRCGRRSRRRQRTRSPVGVMASGVSGAVMSSLYPSRRAPIRSQPPVRRAVERDERDVVGARADPELGDARRAPRPTSCFGSRVGAERRNSAKRSSPNRWRSVTDASVTPSVYSSNVHPGSIVTVSVATFDSKAPSNGPVWRELDRGRGRWSGSAVDGRRWRTGTPRCRRR